MACQVFADLGLNVGENSKYWLGPTTFAYGGDSVAELSKAIDSELRDPKRGSLYREKVVIKVGTQARVYDVKDISASGMRLAGDISDRVGSPAMLIMEGTETPAIIARKGANEFAISLVGDQAREAMTRRVYSDRYGQPIESVDLSRVLAGVLQRLAR